MLAITVRANYLVFFSWL